jgi:HK97 family phage major capsid protein
MKRSNRFLPGPLYGLSPELAAEYSAMRTEIIAEYLSDKKSTAYLAGQFIKASVGGDPAASKWCRENGVALTKASATSPNAAGSFLIPEQIANAVIMLLETYGTVRREATTWPMVSDSQIVPRATGGFVTNWISEGSKAASFAQATFDGLGLTAKKLGAFVKVSNELLGDAVEALGMFFIRGLALGFMNAEDVAIFQGDGTSTYGGITGIEKKLADGAHAPGKIMAAVGHNSFITLDATDIAAAIAALPARAIRNAKIFCSVYCYGNTFVRINGVSGGLVATIGADGQLMANWNGLPIVFSSALNAGSGSQTTKMLMVIGDLEQGVAFGVRRDMRIEKFTETFVDVDQTLIRATERVDIVAADLGDPVNAGALVGLFAP